MGFCEVGLVPLIVLPGELRFLLDLVLVTVHGWPGRALRVRPGGEDAVVGPPVVGLVVKVVAEEKSWEDRRTNGKGRNCCGETGSPCKTERAQAAISSNMEDRSLSQTARPELDRLLCRAASFENSVWRSEK